MEEERVSVFHRLGPIPRTLSDEDLSIEALKQRSNRFKRDKANDLQDSPSPKRLKLEDGATSREDLKAQVSSKSFVLNENGSDEGEIIDDDDDLTNFCSNRDGQATANDESFSDWSDDDCDQLLHADHSEDKHKNNLEAISDDEEGLDLGAPGGSSKRSQPSIIDILNIDWKSFIATSSAESLKSKLEIGEDQNDKIENTEKFRRCNSTLAMLKRVGFNEKLAGETVSRIIKSQLDHHVSEDYSIDPNSNCKQMDFMDPRRMSGQLDRQFISRLQSKYSHIV